MIRKLNLGCGHVALPAEEGWTNLDCNDWPHADVVSHVPPIPLDDESYDHILASHFIEHVPTDKKIDLFNECWRVLKKGGDMLVYVPYARSDWAIADPTHVSFWVPQSFLYFTEQMAYLRYGIKIWEKAEAFIQDNGWVVEARLVK